jgi:hypothetical protein
VNTEAEPTKETTPDSPAAGGGDKAAATEAKKPRHILPIVLIVLATIIGVVSVFALWSERQLLEQDTWSTTSQELIEDSEIQNALADFIVAEVYANVDIQQQLADRLPPELAPLAGPAAAALRQPAQDAADAALRQPKVQALWVEASSVTHQKLIDLIENKGQFVSTAGGVVTLDLQKLLEQVTAQLGIGSRAVSKLPASTASIEIMKSDELSEVQTGVKALQTAAWFLTALTFILFALAIFLGRGRRRETLRSVGISLAAIGLIVLFARSVASSEIVNALSGSSANDAAVSSAFGIITSLLKDTGQSILVYGIVVVLAAWVAGPTAWAVSARRAVTPWLRQPVYAYGALGLVLIVLFWWQPLVATQRLIPSLLLIVLSAAGIEVLRRQVIREFPDLTSHEGSGPGTRVSGLKPGSGGGS